MVVKLPIMKVQEVKKLINDEMLCRIAFKGTKYPYIAPFQYVHMNGSLYFHFTDYGRKMKLIESDNRVCVEIEKLQPDLSEYHFVSLRGNLNVVEDPEERAKVIEKMREGGRQKLSQNFLAAHGLKVTEGWSSFTSDKPLVIVKLEIVEEIGIKSP
jgi:nitroimidazol reductase NimA-like FMN-containing flavoprotein (pyridoxamine 5'-phosphate oxidase superfamily)